MSDHPEISLLSTRMAAIEAVLAYALAHVMSHADLLDAEAALLRPADPGDDPAMVRHMRRLLSLAADIELVGRGATGLPPPSA